MFGTRTTQRLLQSSGSLIWGGTIVASFGYLVFLLRGTEPRRPRTLARLSSAGDDRLDLLHEMHADLSAGLNQYRREDHSSEGWVLRRAELRGRTIDIRVNKGPRSTGGEVYDEEAEESTETSETQALLSGLRAMVALPVDSYLGLLFVERIGIRHLKEVLRLNMVRPSFQRAHLVAHVEAFARASDWRTLLEPQQVLRVTEVLEQRDSGDDLSTVDPTLVRITAEGGAVRAATHAIKETMFERIQGKEERIEALLRSSELQQRREEDPDGFTVEDEREHLEAVQALDALDEPASPDEDVNTALHSAVPVDGGSLRHQRFEVAMGEAKPERTFRVESDAMPQFVYELGNDRLDGDRLREVWLAHTESILSGLGVNLPRGWASAGGPAG